MREDRISKVDIAKSFGKAAYTYDEMAHFQRWTADQLMARLRSSDLKLREKPLTILDLGCGTGYSIPALNQFAGEGLCVGLDISEGMVSYAQEHVEVSNTSWLAADGERLPFRDGQFDLVFSSLAIQWCDDLVALFEEVRRVLKPGGIWAFSTLVDGTLSELRGAWSKVDGHQHVNQFSPADMHFVIAESTGFVKRDIEVVEHCIYYDTVRQLTKELKGIGAHNMTANRPSGLTGKARLKGFLAAYEVYRNREGMLPATYEVLFGVCKKPLES